MNITVLKYDIPVNEKEFKDVLKKKFLENQNVTDIRVVDMLVVKVKAIFYDYYKDLYCI